MVQIIPAPRNNFGLEFGKALGDAVGSYYEAKEKQQKRERKNQHLLDVNSELSKALENYDENMSAADTIRLIGQQKHPETRDQLTNLLKTFHEKKQQNQFSPQKLFSDIVRKHVGNSPSQSDIRKSEEIFAYGSDLLEQGVEPIKAFNMATQAFNKKQEANEELKSVKRKSFFGTNEKEDAQKIARLRKSKILSDDEIFAALTGLGFSPEDVESKFGVRMSDEMLDELGSDQEVSQSQAGNQPQVTDQDIGGQANEQAIADNQGAPQAMAPSAPKQPWNPKDPNHIARAQEILKSTGGDRAKTNQILSQEFQR